MRIFSIVAVACFSLMAAACVTPSTSPSPGTSPPPITAGQQTLLDEKVLFGVEAVYNVAASAYLSADSRDQLTPTNKVRARQFLLDAHTALRAARTAYAVGDARTFNEQIAAAGVFVRQASAFLPSQ